jgi:hypothetical protein
LIAKHARSPGSASLQVADDRRAVARRMGRLNIGNTRQKGLGRRILRPRPGLLAAALEVYADL